MAKPIALAIDFKKYTPQIIKTGFFLAQRVYQESPLVFFHVIEQFFTPPAYLLPYLNIEKERLEKALNELVDPICPLDITVEKRILLGEFWLALKNFLEEIDPEVVVLGYEPHVFKIPTAEKILERLEINFLVVKERALEKIEKILCPIDFSEKSLSALKKAFFIAKKTEAEIKAFYVITPLELGDKSCDSFYFLEKEKEIKDKWERVIEELKPSGINFSFETLCGNRLDEIVRKMEEEKPDLLILGRRGKVLKIGIGSVSKALLKISKIPVYLVN